jgi:hypothetical protein
LQVLFEALLCLADENLQLAFVHGNDIDALAFRLGWQNALKPTGREKKRLWVLALSLPTFFEQAARLRRRWLRLACRNHDHVKDEAARCIHESDAIERSISVCVNWRFVQLKRNPRLVDLELVGMQHGAP